MAAGRGSKRGSSQLRLALSGPAVATGRSTSAEGPGTTRCRQCGKPIDIPEWIRGVEVSLHYCDDVCRRAWVESEPDFTVRLGDSGRRRRGGNWELQARRARERDQYRCQTCGISEEELGCRLHVHHRIPFRRFRSNVEANKLEHLVSVCPSCHSREEADLRRQLPLFAVSPGGG
jgi:5-methylcytosine-specific restriction endonuclease McrA